MSAMSAKTKSQPNREETRNQNNIVIPAEDAGDFLTRRSQASRILLSRRPASSPWPAEPGPALRANLHLHLLLSSIPSFPTPLPSPLTHPSPHPPLSSLPSLLTHLSPLPPLSSSISYEVLHVCKLTGEKCREAKEVRGGCRLEQMPMAEQN
eukprot:493011-Hanusia_phi.AAC.2